MTPTADKSQLALSDTAREHFDEVVEKAGFRERQDAYRLAISLALAEQLVPADADASRTTYLNIGSLDLDGSLRAAVLSTRSDHDGRPVALIERLAEAGIARLHAHLQSGKSLREILLVFQDISAPAATPE